jgi:hypothetical protein
LIHNMNIFFGRLGEEDEEIAALIDASNSSLSAIASQDLDVQRATGLLGPTLRETRIALGETNKLGDVLGPALRDLRPFARKLKPVNDSLGQLARNTRGDVKNKIRPFIRTARKPVRDLRPAAQNLVKATPRLTTVGGKLNKLFNMAAYNPDCSSGTCQPSFNNDGADPVSVLPGPRDEGYLYWLGWLSHVGNSTFQNQDAHGVYRRVFVGLTQDAACGLLKDNPLADEVAEVDQILAELGVC